MAGLFEQFSTDRKAEVEGVLIEMGDGVSFRVARRSKSNKRYTKALEAATKPHAIALDKETMSSELSEEIMLDVFCKTILLDWTGVSDPKHKAFTKAEHTLTTASGPCVPFSYDNAVRLMKALPELYDELVKQATKMALFREASDEADTKA